MKSALDGGGKLASCSPDRLSRSFEKCLKASWTLQRFEGCTLVMLSNIALMPGSIGSRCWDSLDQSQTTRVTVSKLP
jgi:hypothetical protein